MVLACVLGVRRGPPNGLLRLLRQSMKVVVGKNGMETIHRTYHAQ